MIQLLPIFQLVAGLAMLIIGAELVVRGASRIATAAGISSFVVGLTVVAFGTSAPELGGSLGAAIKGNSELAISTIVGSNIANILLILGMTALFCPIVVKFKVVRREVIQMIAVTVIAMALMIGDTIPRLGGVLLFLGLLGFVVRSYINGKSDPEHAKEMEAAAKELVAEVTDGGKPPLLVNIVMVIVGIGLLVYGANLLVGGATAVAQMFGVSDAVIGLTLVAFGTSVPELSLSVIAALRKESDIAIGNILGSNIFNILCVLGITAMVSPSLLEVPEGMWSRDLWVMLGASLACLPLFLVGGKITRAEGFLLLGLYCVYMGVVFVMGGR
ncbi:MAG: calcium/sodium antiporter [Phycisphaerales bacterium JB061]